MVKRILLGCAIVLVCSAGGTAVFVLEQVHTLRDALKQNGALHTGGSLASAGWGDPQTLLLVGDDQRSLTRYYHVAVPHLANEMLLVRLDPSKPYISMMSIPRELWVTIHLPGGGSYTNRINSAYTHGIGVLVRTIKQVTGLAVNHVVVITFGRFKRAVDEMGCVYSTVDRRYFHVNVPGGEQYQEINLRPGYQKLCGTDSLQFVSYRHGDTSLVRDARDQSFLLDVKKQYGPGLAGSVGKFENIFGKAVQTDPGLQSTTGILNLLGTLISSSGRRVRQVHFQANLLPTYDTATPQQVSASVHAFLYGGSAIPKQNTAAVAHAVHGRKAAAQLPLTQTPPSVIGQATSMASNLPFPLEFPRVEDHGGSVVPPNLRNYLIHGPDGTAYPAYVGVFATGTVGQFYDVQGMPWTSAPQFASPDQTVHVVNRTYNLYYEGSNLKMVAWFQHGVVYWVRNTLTDSLSPGEMLAIAEQTTPVAGGNPAARLNLKAAGVPIRGAVSQQKTSLRETVGAIGGLLTLIAVPVLAFLTLRRRRQLAGLKTELAAGNQRGARLPVSPFAPGSAAARAAERARLGSQPRPGATQPRAGATQPRPGATRVPAKRRRLRRRPSLSPSALRLGLLVAVIAAGAAVFAITESGGGAPAPAHHPARVQAPPAPPSVPVTVLNAGTQQGAAAALATQLRGMDVRVGTIGNLSASVPSGLQILYAPGQSAQATRLARLLSAQKPTVAPLDPATAAAAGSGAQLVLVIG